MTRHEILSISARRRHSLFDSLSDYHTIFLSRRLFQGVIFPFILDFQQHRKQGTHLSIFYDSSAKIIPLDVFVVDCDPHLR